MKVTNSRYRCFLAAAFTAAVGTMAMAGEGEKVLVRWDFEVDGNSEGWHVGQGVNELKVEGGVLSGTTSDADAYLFGPVLAQPMDGIAVRIRSRCDRGGGTQVYWRSDATPTYCEKQVARVATPASDDFAVNTWVLGRNATQNQTLVLMFNRAPFVVL